MTVSFLELCYAMLCYAMLCYAMLCYAMLCYAMLCYAVPQANTACMHVPQHLPLTSPMGSSCLAMLRIPSTSVLIFCDVSFNLLRVVHGNPLKDDCEEFTSVSEIVKQRKRII